MEEIRYNYRDGDQVVGPLTLGRIRKLAEAGIIPPDTQIAVHGSDEWRQLNAPAPSAACPPEPSQVPARARPVEGASEMNDADVRKKRTKRRTFLTPVAIVILVGLGYCLFPLWPHEYLYNLQTTGIYGSYPQLGESYDLLKRRFSNGIADDRKRSEGREVWIRNGNCDYFVFVSEDAQVEAVLTVGEAPPSLLAEDFLSHCPRKEDYVEIGPGYWWNERAKGVLLLKSEGALLLATDTGLRLLDSPR